MRILMLGVVLAAVSGCKGNGTANNMAANSVAAGNTAVPATSGVSSTNAAGAAGGQAAANDSAAGSLPAGFPGADLAAKGADCTVYLGLAEQAGAKPAGRDAPIMEQASDQWLAALKFQGHMSEPDIQQLVAGRATTLAAIPAVQRDAAAAWCVENAPEVDPSH